MGDYANLLSGCGTHWWCRRWTHHSQSQGTQIICLCLLRCHLYRQQPCTLVGQLPSYHRAVDAERNPSEIWEKMDGLTGWQVWKFWALVVMIVESVIPPRQSIENARQHITTFLFLASGNNYRSESRTGIAGELNVTWELSELLHRWLAFQADLFITFEGHSPFCATATWQTLTHI